MADGVMKNDTGTYVEAQQLIMERHGYQEETYYTFSYSPIPNDDGGPGGLICANTDNTRHVIGERQLASLRELAVRTTHTRNWRDACVPYRCLDESARTHRGAAVSDTGTGIPKHELPHLFERFHRVEGARGRTFEGSGIGLALVNELVKLHGGTVSVESEVDQGTSFYVRLPFGVEHLPKDRVGVYPDTGPPDGRGRVFVEEVLGWLPGEDHKPSQPPAPDALNGYSFEASAPRAHILLADDNADMRAYVRRLLAPQYEVVAVNDGAAALAAARSRRPDLVLADIMMPDWSSAATKRTPGPS